MSYKIVDQPLFRTEAIAAQRTRYLGPVLVATPVSHTLFTLFAVAALAALVALVAFGEFTRKARVNGWLVPQEGLVRVFAQQPGVVSEIRVREGALARRGDTLMVLSAERQSAALGATQAEITRLLSARRSSMEAEIAQQRQLLAQQRTALTRRVQAMRNEIGQFAEELSVQAARAQLAESSAERVRQLAGRGFVSMQQVQQQEEQALDQRGKLRTLERTRAERARELVALQAELEDLPLKTQAQIATLTRSIALLEQELAESEAKRQIVVPAPQDGVVTSIQVEPGGTANTTTPLLSIVPENSKLEVHLFAPSKAIGFVRPGQRVQLRYHAYPYQKFGHHVGTVDSVSRSAISPAELPARLTGVSSLTGTTDPIYRIVVAIEHGSIVAYGESYPLQPGMQLDADVLLERRRLYEWMLEPLYTLTGRL